MHHFITLKHGLNEKKVALESTTANLFSLTLRACTSLLLVEISIPIIFQINSP